ncbi:SagB/ThcOx family dehydrogenase [Listeria booriae]|uniref:SagB/ThcOx family dehydrogenase n=1 Tax=Listeria booriae TaxID=1552123 RepID=A0A7X0XEM1_9LIST|nr:SagB/ThcOx family dehydrogenase [Listeria booriae]MBC1492764.1 SagB/ThcOx family dehydrogenase [Listeria booriae]
MKPKTLSTEVIWTTEVDRSILRKFFHNNSISKRYLTSVQIKKVLKNKQWENKTGINLRIYEPKTSLEKILYSRRSRRKINGKKITINEISKLLQFSVGITDKENGYFAYPSPGALYPCTLFLSLDLPGFNNVLYRYNPYQHKLEEYCYDSGQVAGNSIIDDELRKFPIKIFFTSDFQLLEDKYGELSYRLLNQEIGHIAQNLLLYAESLGINATCIGGFYEYEFQKKVPEYDLLYVMVVG